MNDSLMDLRLNKNKYIDESMAKDTDLQQNDGDISYDQYFVIPGVTKEKKKNDLEDNVRFGNAFLLPNKYENQRSVSTNVKSFPSFINLSLPNRKKMNKKTGEKKQTISDGNTPEVFFTNGFIKIYSMKIIHIFNHSIAKPKESQNNNIVIKEEEKQYPYEKSIYILGLLNEQFDNTDNASDFEDKIKVDYVKINIINPTSNDQMIQRNYFNNIRGLKEKIDELRNYLKVFFELFSKIKQIVIPFIKSISFEAFLMKTLIEKIYKSNKFEDERNVITCINQLTFFDLVSNIKRFADSIEKELHDGFLGKYLNTAKIDFYELTGIDFFKNYSIFRDLMNLKRFFLDFLIIFYNKDAFKNISNKVNQNHNVKVNIEKSKNKFHCAILEKFFEKILNFFLSTFSFCCFDRVYFNKMEREREIENFQICFECSTIICKKCYKYHKQHEKSLCNLKIFKIDDLTLTLVNELASKEKTLLEKSKTSDTEKDRKYILIIDFIKVLTCHLIITEMIPYKLNMPGLADKIIKNKKFLDEVINHFKEINSKIKMSELQENPKLSQNLQNSLSNFFNMKKCNKAKKHSKEEFQIFINRHLVQDIYIDIKAAESNLKLEVLKIAENNNTFDVIRNDVSLFIASKNSPKQVFRELFVKKCPDNYFLEKWLKPSLYSQRISQIEMELINSNKIVPQRSLLNVLMSAINKQQQEQNPNSLQIIRKSSTNFYKPHENIDKIILNGKTPIDEKKVPTSSEKRKSKFKITKLSGNIEIENNKNENESINNIINNISNFEISPNIIKIIIIFLEIIQDKVENYGFLINEETSKNN